MVSSRRVFDLVSIAILILLPGKQWHETKTAFRPKAGNSTWEKRQVERIATAAVKAKEKEAERKVSKVELEPRKTTN